MLALVLYHVVIEGAERAQIELPGDPACDTIVRTGDGQHVRVHDVVPGADGSRVIMGSWETPPSLAD
jgi:hypothetical protein